MVKLFTFEFFIKLNNKANGGGVITARAVCTSLVIYSALICVLHIFDPESKMGISYFAFRREFVDSVEFLGAIFGGVYLALYARFSSQWSYIADLYNQIKSAELNTSANEAQLSSWKAGFIEDAEDLHLATKGSIASVVHHWGITSEVINQYKATVPGKEARLTALLVCVDKAYSKQEEKYQK